MEAYIGAALIFFTVLVIGLYGIKLFTRPSTSDDIQARKANCTKVTNSSRKSRRIT